MTKTALLTEIGQRLGDTTSGFLTILGNIFDQVLRELAARGAIRSVRQTATFTFTENTQNYSTRTLSGLSSPNYPLDIVQIVVPAWQSQGYLRRVNDEQFERWRLAYIDESGSPIAGQPQVWRLYPNETQLQVQPVPDGDSTSDSVELEFIAPPTALSGSDAITQVRQEHIPYLVAGCVKYGAPFQDETRMDMRTALLEFEQGIRIMKAEAERKRGMTIQARYRDV